MSAVPVPSDFERRTNAVFEALMWALSRPGLPRELPENARETGEALIAGALLDRECRTWCADPATAGAVARTSAEPVELERADQIFAGALDEARLLDRLALGSDLHPEDGATLVVQARIGAGQPVRLTGPGVDGTLDLALGGLPAGFWAKRASLIRYPMGFDILFIDRAQVIGLPRSTRVEVL